MNLDELKRQLKSRKVDYFLLPNSDEFFSEYLPENEKRIRYLTEFTGSNAYVIFGLNKSYFFTDGRYILQAKQELDLREFEIVNLAEKSLFSWISENLLKDQNLGLDAKLSSVSFVQTCETILNKIAAKLTLFDEDVVAQMWQDRPKNEASKIYFLPDKLVGADSKEKRIRVLQGLEADAMIISRPENLCWLLNCRAADVEFTPLLLAYGILFKNGDVDVFVDKQRFDQSSNLEVSAINVLSPNALDSRISALAKTVKKIQIDPATTNYWLYQLLQKNGFEFVTKHDPIDIMKACKNEVEIAAIKKTHEVDGVAVTRFLFWLKNALEAGEEIDEIKAADKLLEFRKYQFGFLYPSFATISGFASNGAVIHYHSSPKTNKKLQGDGLYLVDSGGQYLTENFCGTTDVTRTIAVGKPSKKMIEDFTKVLKGHIALSLAQFPIGTTGAHLDVLARINLWKDKQDYEHGTGHGVGNFLSVHEGPCNISKRGSQPLLPGMVLSNEPGFYLEGQYGIRIENLMLVKEVSDKFLKFETLTLAPLDRNLVDFEMLSKQEKKWLNDYHQLIAERLGPVLTKDEKEWVLSSFNENPSLDFFPYHPSEKIPRL